MVQRLTYHEKATDKAWQRQLREHYENEGLPPGLSKNDLLLNNAMVRPVSRKIAERIIYKYEWLGTMSPTSYHFGLFFGAFCAGVTCVGGANCTGGTNTHRPFNIGRNELLILARGANVHWSPAGANSKLVSWTVKILSKTTQHKILIAYSDTDAGEIGTIYQACNWYYIGAGSSTQQFIAPNGRVYDMQIVNQTIKSNNLVGKVSWSEQKAHMLGSGWTAQKSNPKHRYVAVLDKRDKKLVSLIQDMSLPYPKRADD